MVPFYRKNIGLANAVMILAINCIVGFLSILSLNGSEQPLDSKFFAGRIMLLMLVGLVLTGTLLLLNIVYNLISGLQRSRKWHANVLPVLIWCGLTIVPVAVLGTLFLVS